MNPAFSTGRYTFTPQKVQFSVMQPAGQRAAQPVGEPGAAVLGARLRAAPGPEAGERAALRGGRRREARRLW